MVRSAFLKRRILRERDAAQPPFIGPCGRSPDDGDDQGTESERPGEPAQAREIAEVAGQERARPAFAYGPSTIVPVKYTSSGRTSTPTSSAISNQVASRFKAMARS